MKWLFTQCNYSNLKVIFQDDHQQLGSLRLLVIVLKTVVVFRNTFFLLLGHLGEVKRGNYEALDL